MEELLSALQDRVEVIAAALAEPELPLQIHALVDAITQAHRSGGTVYAFGNGGNAANAEQLITELIARYCYDREPVAAVLLTAAGPFTAINNDYGYESGFARQIEALARPGDIVVGFSTSGSSPNVVAALQSGASRGATTVSFSGTVGKTRALADIPIVVDASFTPTVEESHLILIHLVCGMVEQALFHETGRRIRVPDA